MQMLTYLYIALGGAIGSVARAWTTNAIMRAAGAQFPWGTIVINIAGSFIIGFFGALTASDGRFAAHTDARAFVMVGICGGYTTFSSFSLQTLDLARDGKFAAAFANVALSVLLCLLAVTAGYASAVALNGNAAKIQASSGETTEATILAVIDRVDSVDRVLNGAAMLLAFNGSGRISVLAVRTPPVAELMIADQALTSTEETRLRNAQSAWAGEAKTAATQWEAHANAKTIATDWIDIEGDIGNLVSRYGRGSNAIVIGNAPRSTRSGNALHAALFNTGRPVLVVPDRSAVTFGVVVAIAWRDDNSARKALLAAMPLLAKAKAVHVLNSPRAGKQAVFPSLLEECGIAAQLQPVARESGVAVGARLLARADELGADLLIMGAYTHSEWREAVLGGVTRYVLDHADLPVLMHH